MCMAGTPIKITFTSSYKKSLACRTHHCYEGYCVLCGNAGRVDQGQLLANMKNTPTFFICVSAAHRRLVRITLRKARARRRLT